MTVCNPEEGPHQNLIMPAPRSQSSSLQDSEKQTSVDHKPPVYGSLL